jgi:hypothetical protein
MIPVFGIKSRKGSLKGFQKLSRSIWRRKVSPEEREQMAELCARIAKEHNDEEFIQLVQELNALLEKSAPADRKIAG